MTNDQLDAWFRVLGYGNPEAKVWFAGIEPGVDKGKEAAASPSGLKEFRVGAGSWLYDKAPDGGSRRSRAWTAPAQIVSNVYGPKSYEASWQYMMTANIAPLPRSSLNDRLPGEVDANAYRRKVMEDRIPRFLELLHTQAVRVLVIHGVTARREYELRTRLELVDEEQIIDSIKPMTAYRIRKTTVVLTNSFTRGSSFPNSDVVLLAGKIKGWLKQ